MNDDGLTVTALGRELFRIDWLDILGVGMLVFAVAVASLAVVLK